MSTQHSPQATNSKRRCMDTSDSEPTENLNIRTRSMPGNLSNIVGDPTKYKAIIVPIEFAPIFEKLCQELINKLLLENNKQKEMESDDEVFIIGDEDSELRTRFTNDFGAARSTYDNALRQCDERSLIDDVPSEQLDSFRNARRLLTKWYVTGAHLLRKLKGDTEYNSYINMSFDYSVAVNDNNLKDKCTSKLLQTEKIIENSLTSSVLAKAIILISEVNNLWNDTPKKVFLKAYRVVSKANKHLLHPKQINDTHPKRKYSERNNIKTRNNKDYDKPNNRSRKDPYRKYDWHSRRNRIDSRNDRRHDSFEDYPPLRRDNNNYRHYKRHNSIESDDDYDQRPFRNNNRTYRKRQSFRDRND